MKYWNKQGKHQKTIDAMRASLVPDEGPARSEIGELLRLVENVYYDLANNGGRNFCWGKMADLAGLIYWMDRANFPITSAARMAEVEIRRQALGYLSDASDGPPLARGFKKFCTALDDLLDFLAVKHEQFLHATLK